MEASDVVVPISYQHILAQGFAQAFRPGREAIQDWLLRGGWEDSGQKFKWFCYSGLLSENFSLLESMDKKYLVFPHQELELVFSTLPLPGAGPLFSSLLMGKSFILPGPGKKNELTVIRVDVQKDPVFTNSMVFRTLSPLVIREFLPEKSKFPRFLAPDDPDFSRLLLADLMEKAGLLQKAIVGLTPPEGDSTFQFELASSPKRKLVAMKNSSGFMVQVASWLVDFRLNGDPELARAGYFLGFGDHNPAGFGLCRVMLPELLGKPKTESLL